MAIYHYLGVNFTLESLGLIAESPESILLYENNDELPNYWKSIEPIVASGRGFLIDRDEIKSAPKLVCQNSADLREKILGNVLSDYRVFLLHARFKRFDFHGNFKALTYFSDVVDYALGLAERHFPSVVFCAYTPHTVESWIVVRTLEELGARVIRLMPSPLPWISIPVVGLNNKASKKLEKKNGFIRTKCLEDYLVTLKGSRENALPFYMKENHKSQFYEFLHKLKGSLLRTLFKFFERLFIQKKLNRLASKFKKPQIFAVYFLHYQPEMNTLPEADLYCDQFQAIKKISDSLPVGAMLVVKEHPSTFKEQTDLRWRPANFYDRIISLPNVILCSEKTNVFELIDEALFVSSISGVCLTEALARGKVAVTFNSHRFALFKQGLVIDANSSSVAELRNLFCQIASRNLLINPDELRESFNQIMLGGYDGVEGDVCIPQSGPQSHAISKKACILAVRDVIDGAL